MWQGAQGSGSQERVEGSCDSAAMGMTKMARRESVVMTKRRTRMGRVGEVGAEEGVETLEARRSWMMRRWFCKRRQQRRAVTRDRRSAKVRMKDSQIFWLERL